MRSISLEYGLGEGTLKYWLKDYYKDKPEEKAADSAYSKLQRENEELKKELDFLKKAASYFASLPKK